MAQMLLSGGGREPDRLLASWRVSDNELGLPSHGCETFRLLDKLGACLGVLRCSERASERWECSKRRRRRYSPWHDIGGGYDYGWRAKRCRRASLSASDANESEFPGLPGEQAS